MTTSSASLTCEQIGSDRPWVAEITGADDKFGLKREFLAGVKDYSRANKPRTRGVMTTFFLSPGKVYEIKAARSWSKSDRYFVVVEDGEIKPIDAATVADRIGGVA